LCDSTPYVLQHGIIALYIIFLIPSLYNIAREILCVYVSTRSCVEDDSKPDNYRVSKIVDPGYKRVAIIILLVLPEMLILIAMFYVGTRFM
jgi:hypothetical protein